MSDKQRRDQNQTAAQDAPHGGMPGDGAGRIEDPGTRGHGVFPVSGPPSGNPDATTQGMASFGQGARGAAGYEDSGRSEVFTMPPGDPTASGGSSSGGPTQQRPRSQADDVGNVGSNAGEVDPGISGSGETVGEAPQETGGAGFGNAAGGGGVGDAARTADRPRR